MDTSIGMDWTETTNLNGSFQPRQTYTAGKGNHVGDKNTVGLVPSFLYVDPGSKLSKRSFEDYTSIIPTCSQPENLSSRGRKHANLRSTGAAPLRLGALGSVAPTRLDTSSLPCSGHWCCECIRDGLEYTHMEAKGLSKFSWSLLKSEGYYWLTWTCHKNTDTAKRSKEGSQIQLRNSTSGNPNRPEPRGWT